MSYSPPTLGKVPGDCDRIIIVGAGGFGREVLHWARHAWPENVSMLAGFLSADPAKLDGHDTTLPIIGSPEDFVPRPTDAFVLAIGVPRVRRRVVERLEAQGARFLTLIHPTAIVADTATIGMGTVVCPYAVVSDAVRLGRFVLVNYHASLGHDAAADDFAVLSPYTALGGAAQVCSDVFMALHTSIAPGRQVRERTVVSIGSCVVADVGADQLVFGVPGRSRAAVGPDSP